MSGSWNELPFEFFILSFFSFFHIATWILPCVGSCQICTLGRCSLFLTGDCLGGAVACSIGEEEEKVVAKNLGQSAYFILFSLLFLIWRGPTTHVRDADDDVVFHRVTYESCLFLQLFICLFKLMLVLLKTGCLLTHRRRCHNHHHRHHHHTSTTTTTTTI